jgi:hypothetical protein
MSINQAYLIKGWLLGEHPPQEIKEAIEVVIAALSCTPTPAQATVPPISQAGELPPIEVVTEPAPASPARQKREWSPEAKAAASERMRARIAAGKMKRKSSPGEAQAPSQGGA